MSVTLKLSGSSILADGVTFTCASVASIEQNGHYVELKVYKDVGFCVQSEKVPGSAFARAVKERIKQLEFQDEVVMKDNAEKRQAWEDVLILVDVKKI